MTRYFMRDTPLCQMEQQMMTPPYFKPRGHGRYYPGFQYSRDDMECPYCMNFRRNHPCPLEQCVCLDERIVAGAIDLNEFVRDCFFPEAGVQLQARLERSFNGCSIGFFLSDSHRERWQHWRARCYRMSDRDLAALFLLTAYEDIANDILSAVALMEADSVLRLANCDLKSIGYLSSQLPLLRELHWDEDKQYKAASNIKPLQAADRIGQVLGSVAFQLPHSQELEEQYLEGTLLNDLSMKDSKAFRREIEKICKEVF